MKRASGYFKVGAQCGWAPGGMWLYMVRRLLLRGARLKGQRVVDALPIPSIAEPVHEAEIDLVCVTP